MRRIFHFYCVFIFAFVGFATVMAQDKASVKAWKENIDNGKKALEKNDTYEASDRFQDALALAEKFPPDDARLSETLIWVGKAHIALGEYPAAETAVRRALTLDEKRLGTNSVHLIDEDMNRNEQSW